MENIYPRNYLNEMRPTYRHILNIGLINLTLAIRFFKRRGHQNKIAEWKMKEKKGPRMRKIIIPN